MDASLRTRIEKEIKELNIILENYKKLNKRPNNILARRIMDLEDDILMLHCILNRVSLNEQWQDCYLDDLQN